MRVQIATPLVQWDNLSELKIVVVSSLEICEKEHSKTGKSDQRLERKELSLSGQRKDHSLLSCKWGCAAGEC